MCVDGRSAVLWLNESHTGHWEFVPVSGHRGGGISYPRTLRRADKTISEAVGVSQPVFLDCLANHTAMLDSRRSGDVGCKSELLLLQSGKRRGGSVAFWGS